MSSSRTATPSTGLCLVIYTPQPNRELSALSLLSLSLSLSLSCLSLSLSLSLSSLSLSPSLSFSPSLSLSLSLSFSVFLSLSVLFLSLSLCLYLPLCRYLPCFFASLCLCAVCLGVLARLDACAPSASTHGCTWTCHGFDFQTFCVQALLQGHNCFLVLRLSRQK